VSEPTVLVERPRDGVALVTLNRPAARNAIDGALAADLERAVLAIEGDASIHAAVLTGAGDRAFCAGADLAVMASGGEAALWTAKGGFAGFIEARRTKLWIAAVNGAAVAGGFEIVLACDVVVATEHAVFGLPEVKRGLIAGAGGLYRLPRALPRAVALEMIATGEPIPAARAMSLGLVNRVVPSDLLRTAALDIAGTVAANAPLAVRESLAIARTAAECSDAELLMRSHEALDRIRSGDDIREGARAFLEKRAPRWVGR
jgi:enoyl-CoA hydratase/carnithine racemase